MTAAAVVCGILGLVCLAVALLRFRRGQPQRAVNEDLPNIDDWFPILFTLIGCGLLMMAFTFFTQAQR